MYLSKYFLPVIKEDPKEAFIVSHTLMLRSGMIRQLIAGIYNWLPLGYQVLKNVENVIREEMNAIGGLEILMPCIQPIELWKKSGRYGTGDDLSSEMLKITDRHQNDLTFAPTAEEVIAELFNGNVQSYKNLPMSLYQISWKFRDEIRPRFGVMRGREFLMKDAYSFHMSKECALKTYEQMVQAYIKAFTRMGLTALPVKADTGAMGGDYSHEFHILADTGESEIFFEEEFVNYLQKGDISLKGISNYYANEQAKHNPEDCPISSNKLQSRRGIEIGHIFYLGDKYSKSLDVTVQDNEGKLKHPDMGCYGIGVSRLTAAIIEANHDERGIIWPESVAPFKVGIINLKPQEEACTKVCEDLYRTFKSNNIDILLDDTNDSAGAKFARMDLIGLPYSIAVGPKGIQEGLLEVKERKGEVRESLSVEAIKNKFIK